MKSQKNKNKNRSSLEKINNLIFLAVFIIVLAVAAVIINNFYYTGHFSKISSFKQSYSQAAGVPVIASFAINKLENGDFYRLRKGGRLEYNRQVVGVSSGLDAPPAIPNAEVFNPQIGKTLIIFWQQSKNLDYHFVRLYRSAEENAEKQLVADNLPLIGHYQDIDLENDKIYYYEVRAVADLKTGETESENNQAYFGMPTDKIPPTSPQEVQVTNTNVGHELKITWVNPKDKDLSDVIIYRTEKIGEATESNIIAKITDGRESYLDQAVEDNVIYYYTVTALDNSGNESPKDILLTDIGNSNPFYLPINTNTNNNR